MQPSANLFTTYKEAESLLAAGDLQKSADLCKHILSCDPNFAHGYHLMAALFRATGNLDKALHFTSLAIGLDPKVANFYLQQGQVCFALSDWQHAAGAFEKAFMLQPANALAAVLWADALAQQGKFDEASELFAKARDIQNIPEIDEHEGLCLVMKGDGVAAEPCFDRVMRRRPDYAGGFIHKAKLLLARNDYREAERFFARALKIDPDAYEALVGMVGVSKCHGRIAEAMDYAMRAIQARPTEYSAYLLLAALVFAQANWPVAEQALRQALMLKRGDLLAQQMLVSTLMRQRKSAEALASVEEVLAADPANSEMRYFRSMLTGEATEAAPSGYITGLFDGFAEDFDHHLQHVLSYRTPTLLADAIRGLPLTQGRKGLSLLDLGCGTGLAAAALADITVTRTGVDLSEKMLEKARAKKLYDELHALDIVEYAIGVDRPFDIVLAADVLVYIGNLEPLICAARNALAAGSIFAFSVERHDGDQHYRLNSTGRYSHSPRYIESLAAGQGYTVLSRKDVVLRTEGNEPVHGLIFILQKSQTH